MKNDGPCNKKIITNKNLKNLEVEIVLNNDTGIVLNVLFCNQNVNKNILKVYISWNEIEELLKKFNLDSESKCCNLREM